MANELRDFLAPDALRRRAGERFFERGESYCDGGAVRALQAREVGLEAVVQGTHRYRVRLWIEDGDLDFDCRCPVGREGAFCKHCVAVGLAWHAGGVEPADEAGSDDPGAGVDLRRYLSGLDKEALVSLVVDQAAEDERFGRRLVLSASRSVVGDASESVWKKALGDALAIDHYVSYHDAYDYFSGIDEVVDSLGEMLRAGEAGRVVSLAEHAVDEIEDLMVQVDDSDGWIGGLLHRLQQLHLEACRLAPPDPVDLAERLFEAEIESDYDAFHNAAVVYADVLGAAGLAAYRELAQAAWARVPALSPGDEDPGRFGDRFRITSIMEGLALATDDFEALIAVKSRDLSKPYAFLQIAQLFHGRDEADAALDWAERGWRAFAGQRADDRLREFIADAYQARGRRDEAMALVWDGFADRPGLDTFKKLRAHARRAKAWPHWREKALARVRERIAEGKAAAPVESSWGRLARPDHSLLVEIFLDERDIEAAWREAEAGGCSDRLWLALAKSRSGSHPGDAIRVYEGHVADLLRQTGDRVYHEVVGYVDEIRTIRLRSNEEATFRGYMTELRATHKRKRNLMKLLDAKGW